MREGTECGTAAPMRLVSIGSNPQIAFSPPPALTCDMIAALHRWLQRDVQPLARKHLGAPVVSVATMSSYSCRNAYGRKNGRLSEHGRANALDIGAFVTAKGQTTMVVADWGPIAREIAAQAAAAQKQREAEAAAAAARQKNGMPPAQAPAVVAAPQPLRPSIGIDLPGIAVQMPGASAPTALGLTGQNRLGGPKQQGDPVQPAAPRHRAPDGQGPVPPCRPSRRVRRVWHGAGTGGQQRAQEPLPRRHGRAQSSHYLRIVSLPLALQPRSGEGGA